jgi:hypothetical protein
LVTIKKGNDNINITPDLRQRYGTKPPGLGSAIARAMVAGEGKGVCFGLLNAETGDADQNCC